MKKNTCADLIVFGKIYTGEKDVASAMAVRDGVFLYVGRDDEETVLSRYQGPHTEVLHIAKGLILPGMTEGHAHVTSYADLLFGVSLYDGNSVQDYLEAIARYAAAHPADTVITGKGYINGIFPSPGPTARMLDSVCPDIPAVLSAEDCHSVWVNSKALELMGIDENTPEPENGEIVRYSGSKRPTGWLKESAMLLSNDIKPAFTVEHYKQAILAWQEMALSEGITNCFEPFFDARRDYQVRLEAYRQLAKEGKLKVTFRGGFSIEAEDDLQKELEKSIQARSLLQKDGIDTGSPDDIFRINTVKLFADGVLEGRSACLKEPYADETGGCGSLLWKQEALNEFALAAQSQGFLLHTHAIGDAALDAALTAYEYAQEHLPENHSLKGTDKNAVTHLQIVSETEMDRLAKDNIIAVVNPYWHFKDPAYFDAVEVPYLGRERAEREYPLSSLYHRGIRMSQASDFPVSVPAATFKSLHLMVNRAFHTEPLNQEECLSVSEGLELLTAGGAWQLGLIEKKGTITVDKHADFVIIDNDVLTMEPQRIYTTRVLSTYVHGQKVWSSIERTK